MMSRAAWDRIDEAAFAALVLNAAVVLVDGVVLDDAVAALPLDDVEAVVAAADDDVALPSIQYLLLNSQFSIQLLFKISRAFAGLSI